jgi:peptide subunit release factor RF-3
VLGDELSQEEVLAGNVTPMFFGSAFQTVGVDLFLTAFCDW